MFEDIQQFTILREQMLLKGGGLGMGVSDVKDCAAKYLRVEGGKLSNTSSSQLLRRSLPHFFLLSLFSPHNGATHYPSKPEGERSIFKGALTRNAKAPQCATVHHRASMITKAFCQL
jgi:hypothetical protein